MKGMGSPERGEEPGPLGLAEGVGLKSNILSV
jgi:hypothetical protein